MNKSMNVQRGFSMFELVVYLLSASILFAAALSRYQDFPGEAERANFTAVLAQLKTGVNLQMILALTSSKRSMLDELEGSNPMDLMLETPNNYVGALSAVDESQLPRRVWYFDTVNGELIYLADRAENLFLLTSQGRVPSERIRFQVRNIYHEAENEPRSWQGINIVPVEPYEWRRIPLEVPQPSEEERDAVNTEAVEAIQGIEGLLDVIPGNG